MAASDNLRPEQLSMFMSAREIRQRYQPLDNDREGSTSDGTTTYDSHYGAYPTARTTGGNTRRHGGGGKLFMRNDPETDDQLWERKADEASDWGLTDELRDEGVEKPVSLSTSIGSSGKPQVVGGHHRIAAMGDVDPDALMPVLHYTGFHQAIQQGMNQRKGRGGFPYT